MNNLQTVSLNKLVNIITIEYNGTTIRRRLKIDFELKSNIKNGIDIILTIDLLGATYSKHENGNDAIVKNNVTLRLTSMASIELLKKRLSTSNGLFQLLNPKFIYNKEKYILIIAAGDLYAVKSLASPGVEVLKIATVKNLERATKKLLAWCNSMCEYIKLKSQENTTAVTSSKPLKQSSRRRKIEREIYQRYKAANYTISELALQYNLPRQDVIDILKRYAALNTGYN